VTRSKNGPLFKRERADQLRIPPTMCSQLLPPMGSDATARRQVAPRSKPQESKSQGDGRQQAAARQPPAGSVLEPACPEAAGDTSRSLTSRPTISEPDEESWDFDGCE
jgi:hypothetical protein